MCTGSCVELNPTVSLSRASLCSAPKARFLEFRAFTLVCHHDHTAFYPPRHERGAAAPAERTSGMVAPQGPRQYCQFTIWRIFHTPPPSGPKAASARIATASDRTKGSDKTARVERSLVALLRHKYRYILVPWLPGASRHPSALLWSWQCPLWSGPPRSESRDLKASADKLVKLVQKELGPSRNVVASNADTVFMLFVD